MQNTRLRGKFGENLALKFLKNNGYKIISTNYRNKLGEVDIIAKDKDTYCFIEVKLRSSQEFGLAAEAIDRRKQRRLCKAALCYLKEKHLLDKFSRFDVVLIDSSSQVYKIELIKNAFELEGNLIY